MLVFLIALAKMTASDNDAAPQGNWRNPSGSVIINIAPCGDAFCGHVLWASDKAQEDARKGGTDPLVGAELLSNFIPKAEGRWTGVAFVPDVNKRSRAEIRQLGPDKLKVTGCAVVHLLCKSQIWTRATVQLK